MIDTIWIYFRRNVARNSNRILATTHPYLSGIISLSLSTNFPENRFSRLNLSEIVDLFLTYNTVAFGFSLTAIAICLSTANRNFILFISKTSAFRDLIFVFSWNAIVHFLCIILIFFAYLYFGPTSTMLPTSIWKSACVFIFAWVQIYAIFQFLVSFIAIYEFADLFAQFAAKQSKSKKEPERK